ncbi:hypothetical protein HY991_06180 [Candidatus Micrarchaeota archaeon]|nr:hypothetical protein [Candidatus Micrarchaeota archaeon]
MADLNFLLSEAFFILLFAIVLTVMVFPFVFVMSFIYSSLVQKYKKTPRIFLMILATFIGCLAAAMFIELYLGVSQILFLLGKTP